MLHMRALVMLTLAITAAPAPAQQPEAEAPLPPPPLDSLEDALPGLSVDFKARQLELDATVVLQEGDWLELLACSPDSREHESIFTVEARPSHIHLALLLLNYQPGSPMRWEQTEDGYTTHPPRGDLVSIFIAYENEAGDEVEVPANAWVRHQPTGDAMAGNVWLFAGSTFEQFHQQNVYVADLNGTAVSLVNFGDDLLARPTEVTNQTDNQRWTTFADRIPEPGTAVKLRLRPYEGKAEDVMELTDEQQERQDETPPPPGTGHDAPPEAEQ